MALDPTRFPLLCAELLKIIQQPDVLLQISFRGSGSLEYPTKTASASWGTFFDAKLDQLIEASIEAGVTVIDGRPCDVDAYVSLVIGGPMVAVGPSRRWRIDGTDDALSSLAIADYAPLYAAIGAIVHNLPAPSGEPEAIAA